MKRQHQYFDEFLRESLDDSKIKAEYDRLQSGFAMIEAILKVRRLPSLDFYYENSIIVI